MPYFVSTVVLVGMINLFFSYNGLANNIGALFGAEPQMFLMKDCLLYTSPPVPPVRQHQARFLPHLAQQAVFGAFALLALAASTDPFALVFVVGLFGAVQHQASASLFDVAQRRILHCRPRAQKRCV